MTCATAPLDSSRRRDTPEDLLTLLIKRTGLRQNLKRGARPASIGAAAAAGN